MRLIREIFESELGIAPLETKRDVEVRNATRAVVFDAEGNVGICHVAKENYWKIPGGGVEAGEDFLQALRRELLEEAGVEISVEKELGVIVEHRDQWNQFQISYGYGVRVVGEKKESNFDDGEKEEGFSLHWMPYEEALKKFLENENLTYEAKFMQTRDRMFLECAGN